MLQWILYWRKEQKQLQAQMRSLKRNQRQREYFGYSPKNNRWRNIKSR